MILRKVENEFIRKDHNEVGKLQQVVDVKRYNSFVKEPFNTFSKPVFGL